MKIIYTSDLHVDEDHYQRLLKLEEDQKPDCLIIGGDLIPISPFANESIDHQREFIKGSIIPWTSKLKDSKPNLDLYLMMGNYDKAINMDLLEGLEREGIIHLLHKRHYTLEPELHLVGYGYVPITPFSLKDWERCDTDEKIFMTQSRKSFISIKKGMQEIDLKEILEKEKTIQEDMECFLRMSDPRKTIYVIHSPPYDTVLDRIIDGSPCGSKSIRRFIEKHQPPLSLHGHIHESPQVSGSFMEKIGKTIAINPGQEAGKLHAVVFNTNDVKRTIHYLSYT
ncbi:MAG: metallophosphoesterase [Thermodesulfobacteriota bacterium]|nr:metallophosphoesterase [Thermodesulfobacteriota bacterium]